MGNLQKFYKLNNLVQFLSQPGFKREVSPAGLREKLLKGRFYIQRK
jgi:hypothetical protein